MTLLGTGEQCQERTALPRASSRAYGTKFGRPKKVADAGHIAIARRMNADGHTGRDIAKYLGISRAALYRYLAEEAA
jgi:DNA invertase Pin-like site-specific DNA recombinase